MRVLVTRAADAAARTAGRLRERGHEPALLPLVAYRDSGKAVPPGEFDGVAFTSAAAITTFAARAASDPALARLLKLPAMCVGAATAEAARGAGMDNIVAGNGDAAGLADTIKRRFAGMGGRILYLSGADRAFDLAGEFAGSSILVEELALYAADLIDPGQQAFAGAISQCAAALIYSARTGNHLCSLAGRHGAGEALAGLRLAVISKNVADALPAPLRQNMLVARRPDESALLDLLDRRPQSGI